MWKEHEFAAGIRFWVPHLAPGSHRMARRDGYRGRHVGRRTICPMVVDRLQRRGCRCTRLRHLVDHGKRLCVGHAVPVVHGDVGGGHPAVLGVDVVEPQTRCLVIEPKGSGCGWKTPLVEPDHRLGVVSCRRRRRTASTRLAQLPLAKPERELTLSRLWRVGTVNQVLLNLGTPIPSKISTNRAGCGR